MATWKSYRRKAKQDYYLDMVDVECWWEYQTTADIFSYYEQATQDNSYLNIKKGDFLTKINMGPEDAERLYHALAKWMGSYNSEKDMMKAVENNMFDYDEELDG